MACTVQSSGAYRRVVATLLSDSLPLCRGCAEARRTFGNALARTFPTFDACQPGQRKCFLYAKSDGAVGHLALEHMLKAERFAFERYDGLRGYPGDVQEAALALWTEATEAVRDYRAKHP
jgi:hypothetical protein